MKRFFCFFIIAVMALSLCACGNSELTSNEQSDGGINVGESFSVRKIGDFVLNKIETTEKISSSVNTGSYFKNIIEDYQYIDIVYRLRTKANDISLANEVSIFATSSKGDKYDDFIIATETADNSGLETDVILNQGMNVTVHIALSVPKADDSYTINLKIGSETQSFDYKIGDKISNSKEIKVGQSLNNARLKLRLDKVEYRDKLYENSNYMTDCPDGYAYLASEFTLSNKAVENIPVNEAIRIYSTHDGKSFDATYYLSRDDGKTYKSKETLNGVETVKVLAIISVPIEYTRFDAQMIISIDYQEFLYEIQGSNEYMYNMELKEIEEEKQRIAEEKARKHAEELQKKLEEEQKKEESEKNTEPNINENQNEQSNTQSPQDDTATESNEE